MLTSEKNASVQAPPRQRKWLSRLLTLFLLLLVVGGSLGTFAYIHLHAVAQVPKKVAARPALSTGPFVQQPLSAQQINNLWHLSSHVGYQQVASMYVSHMSLDEELGQLIMVQYYTSTYSADLATSINQLHAGGVILYQWQMHTFKQTKNDIRQMQGQAKVPLFISTDEEGGYVDRLEKVYPRRLGATDIFATGNVNVARQQGAKTARDMLALGLNNDMAPDVDVPLINGPDQMTRTFGNTAGDVIKYAGAYLQTMQGAGVVACLKHFPGLGSATIDAHQGLPVINRSKAQINAVDLAPYKAFIQSQNRLLHPGMIMATDLLMPAIDPRMPAELSPTFITDILRNQLHYNGVVLSDALYMQGIAQRWSVPQAAVLALKAGVDMLIGPNGSVEMAAVINAIKQALKDGTLSRARIDEAATHIITLKMQYHLIPVSLPRA